jgi:hypothetical protein
MSFVEKRVLVRVVDTRQACDTRGPGNPHRDCFWPTGTILRPMEYRCGRWGVGMRGMVRSKNFSGAGPFLVLCEGQGRWRSCRRPSCLVVFFGSISVNFPAERRRPRASFPLPRSSCFIFIFWQWTNIHPSPSMARLGPPLRPRTGLAQTVGATARTTSLEDLGTFLIVPTHHLPWILHP